MISNSRTVPLYSAEYLCAYCNYRTMRCTVNTVVNIGNLIYHSYMLTIPLFCWKDFFSSLKTVFSRVWGSVSFTHTDEIVISTLLPLVFLQGEQRFAYSCIFTEPWIFMRIKEPEMLLGYFSGVLEIKKHIKQFIIYQGCFNGLKLHLQGYSFEKPLCFLNGL